MTTVEATASEVGAEKGLGLGKIEERGPV